MITKKRERSPRPTDQHRRSLRRHITTLQNVASISYSEVIKEGTQPEIYTEEHEKLLGNTEKTWKLFVDGVRKDGKRIYDYVQGKTCHQCRKITLGYRTRCCKCKPVQGQFCGDCLYMRYREHVLEALADPTWICPVCRGICNCSLCRQEKGWTPTGALYKKASGLGYKSVAHYLIQTRRSDTDVEKNDDGPNPVSVKRSPLSDEDDKYHEVNDTKLGFMQPIAETVGDRVAAKRLLTCSDEQLVKLEKVDGLDTDKSLASSTKPSPNEQYQLVKLEKVEGLDTDKPLASSIKPSPDEQYQLVKLEKVDSSDTGKPLVSSTKPSPDEQYFANDSWLLDSLLRMQTGPGAVLWRLFVHEYYVYSNLADPTWICPVCRGICNCSLCRQAKGWAPTGALYKKASGLGYKSVAHYLIQTRRSDTDVEKNDDGPNPVSVKRSPLSDEDDKYHEVNDTKLGFMQPIAETFGDGVAAKRSLTCPDQQDHLVKLEKVNGPDTIKPLAYSTKPNPNAQDQLVKLEKIEGLDTDKSLACSNKPSVDEQYQLVKLEKFEGSDTYKPLASYTQIKPR